MDPLILPEMTKFWIVPSLGDLELLHANYRKHTFNRHFHDGYAVGVIEQGALGFHYLGKNQVASAGRINLAIPGEAHNGFAASDGGWRYRMFYLKPELLARAAREATGRSRGLPIFKMGVIKDPHLARSIQYLHKMLEKRKASLLEQESLFLMTMSQLIIRHSEQGVALAGVKAEKKAVSLVKDYIQANLKENISLETLSRIAGLSRFHLLRVFRKETGLPPHAYLTQSRVVRAKKLMARGIPLVDVALDTGFVDQSHLNRQFKKTYGVPPGQYSNSIQDG